MWAGGSYDEILNALIIYSQIKSIKYNKHSSTRHVVMYYTRCTQDIRVENIKTLRHSSILIILWRLWGLGNQNLT